MPTRKPSSKSSSKPLIPTLPILEPKTPLPTTIPPTRSHESSYHWPLLLSEQGSCERLLEWFNGVEEAREMPWRKQWIDPEEIEGKDDEDAVGRVLARRGYEVWVSEIMLQQTRVSTVISYYKNWISKWPTIHDLAGADHDDVLAAWKGLGYYSRATRLHQGAQDMIKENKGKPCPIPSGAEDLQKFSGIGRYTAGAISSIAFGEAEPVLDGNVIRVLSRQLGLYSDPKDKKTTDFLWTVADRLVKHVSKFPEIKNSATPGQWNQALMELGSTVCTPRPKCDECPIRSTCRVYAEGEALSTKKRSIVDVPDIEDACSFCEQLDTEDLAAAVPEEDEKDEQLAGKPIKKRKTDTKNVNKISQYFNLRTPRTKVESEASDKLAMDGAEVQPVNGNHKRKAPEPSGASKSAITYCSLYPKKVVKKKVAEEECVVCAIEARMSDGGSKWLIEQRPAKGLLASLWQFPQITLSSSNNSIASDRNTSAHDFVSKLKLGHIEMSNAKHRGELGSHVHVFSHLKLTMYVHCFSVDVDDSTDLGGIETVPPKRWVATAGLENETLSTGMRRCWDLIQKT